MTSKRSYEENAKFGAKGGKATKAKHGQEHYTKIGRQGGLKGGKGADHVKAGKAGGKAVKAKYGPNYFRQIALKRWAEKKHSSK